MKQARVDVGRIRREQIVEAAVAVIAEEGLQNLSLSAIEQRAGMSRGQLTYYFPAKEDILLAVFDRLLQMMHERAQAGASDSPCQAEGSAWERLQHFLAFLVLQPPAWPEFHALQYTFLSQIGHRDDFRRRLASLYEEWRTHLAADLAPDLERRGAHVSPRTVASFIQAVLHGLAMQRAADPEAYDRHEMLGLCLEMLGHYLAPPSRGARPTKNGKAPRKKSGAAGPRGVP